MDVENKKKVPIEQDIVFVERQHNKGGSSAVRQGVVRRGYQEVVLNIFDKTPEIGRLLVRLHDRNKLYSIAKEPDDLARAELSQTMVELLGFELEDAESELIVDVLMSLISQAEKDLRRALSERLAVMEGVPLRLVLKMASDDIFVADPVLRKSVDLKDFDLIYILKAQGPEHWQAIAQRPQISEKVVDMLVDTEDFGTVLNVVKNKSIHLSDHAVGKAADMAKESDELAQPLLTREELSEELVSTLYRHVGAALKDYIKSNFSAVGEIEEAIDKVVDEFSDLAKGEYAPTRDLMAQAEKMMERGALSSSSMVEHLRRGQISSFTAQFSVYCALPVYTVEEMIRQKTAQSLAIACKANQIPKADFINMFLLTSRVRGARIINESDLSRAVAYYDKVSEAMAKDLMKKYRH